MNKSLANDEKSKEMVEGCRGKVRRFGRPGQLLTVAFMSSKKGSAGPTTSPRGSDME
jgi:hypothetical protein